MRKTRKFAEGGDDFNTTDYASSGSAGGTNMSFKEAFRAARKQGLDKFTWKGKSFTTELASAKKSEPAKAAESSKKPEPANKDEPYKPSSPSTRGGARRKPEPMEEVTVSASRKKPSFGANFANTSGFQVADAEDGMSTKERRAALGNVAGAAASTLPIGRAVRAAKAGATELRTMRRLGIPAYRDALSVGKGPLKPSTRYTDPDKVSARRSGGSIKKYASGGSVRGKGCEVKGTGKGRMR